jgi:ubiquinone/menaquinone biosynthesis C-methylase UbiE
MHDGVIKQQADLFLTEFNIKKEDKILDVGCGFGLFQQYIHEKGYSNTLGITKAEKDIDNLIKTDTPYRTTDITFTGLDSNYTDHIWCRHCIEHSPFPFLTLLEFNRIMKIGGFLYLEMPAPDQPAIQEHKPNHYSVLPKEMWASLLIRSGFKTLKFGTIDMRLKRPGQDEYPEQWYAYMAQKIEEKSLF